MGRQGYFYQMALAGALLILGVTFIGVSTTGHTASIGVDQELQINLNSKSTGVRVKNLSLIVGEISVETLPGAISRNLTLPDGFVLLDNTLSVTSNLISGKRRIRARMDFGRYGGRIGIRARGIRANTIRLLRADLGGRRWIRAVDSIPKRSKVNIRYLTALRTDFVLGRHGIDKENEFVWAMLDIGKNQLFAIGGLAAVPIPAAWLLFLSGSGLLVLVSRKRRPGAS